MEIDFPVFGITTCSKGEFSLDKWNYDFAGKPIDLDVNFSKEILS